MDDNLLTSFKQHSARASCFSSPLLRAASTRRHQATARVCARAAQCSSALARRALSSCARSVRNASRNNRQAVHVARCKEQWWWEMEERRLDLEEARSQCASRPA